MSRYLNLIRLLRKHFEGKLQKKTGWGRNELIAQFDQAATDALAELLDDQQSRNESQHQAGEE